MTDCYSVRIVARVDSVSANSGYITGGQTLEITGKDFGFNSADITVEIDGVACDVLSSTDTSIICVTNAREAGASTVDVS